jgi:hypothetical protein
MGKFNDESSKAGVFLAPISSVADATRFRGWLDS